jgi:hypothetical protein
VDTITKQSRANWGTSEIPPVRILHSILEPLYDANPHPQAIQILQTLLTSGLDPNELDSQGWNLLHRACAMRCSNEVISVILPFIREIKAHTADGKTALDLCHNDPSTSRDIINQITLNGG